MSYLDGHQLRQFSSIPGWFFTYGAILGQGQYQVGAEIPTVGRETVEQKENIKCFETVVRGSAEFMAREKFMRLEGFWGALLCGLLQVAPRDHTSPFAGIALLLELVLLWLSEQLVTSVWGNGQFCCRAAIAFSDPLHHQEDRQAPGV